MIQIYKIAHYLSDSESSHYKQKNHQLRLGPEPDSHMSMSVADNYTNKGMSWLLWLLINYEAVT